MFIWNYLAGKPFKYNWISVKHNTDQENLILFETSKDLSVLFQKNLFAHSIFNTPEKSHKRWYNLLLFKVVFCWYWYWHWHNFWTAPNQSCQKLICWNCQNSLTLPKQFYSYFPTKTNLCKEVTEQYGQHDSWDNCMVKFFKWWSHLESSIYIVCQCQCFVCMSNVIAIPNSTQSWVGLIFLRNHNHKITNNKTTPNLPSLFISSYTTKLDQIQYSMQPYFNPTIRLRGEKNWVTCPPPLPPPPPTKIFKIWFWKINIFEIQSCQPFIPNAATVPVAYGYLRSANC